MRFFKFEDNIKKYIPGETDKFGKPKLDMAKSSHLLRADAKKGLKRFITFDSESNTIYMLKDKIISSDEYNKLKFNTDKFKVFNIKVITACFCTGIRYTNHVYIQGDSEFKESILKFVVKGKRKKAQVFYSENIIKLFMYHVFKFSASGTRSYKKDGTFCRRTVQVYAHNTKHDWLQIGLFNFHKEFNVKFLSYRFQMPRFCNIDIGDNIMLTFQDTMNFFKTKLENIGESIGIKKLKENVDFTKELVINEKMLQYAMIDSVILVEKMLIYSNQVKQYGKIKYGVPSTAYNIWITSFMDEKIWLHKNPCLMKLERMSFYGGRTEAYRLGYFENAYGIDENSMYPDKEQQELPCSYVKSLRDGNGIKHLKYERYKKSFCMLVECIICSDLKIPLIPHRHDGKLIFINGENIEKVLCQPEVDKLIEMGADVKITGLHLYNKGFPMKKFSEYFMKMKVEGKEQNDSSKAEFGKFNPNSVYGKTCEKFIESIELDCDPDLMACMYEEYEDKTYYFSYLAGKKTSSKKLDFDSKDAYCILGSFITSYARVDIYNQLIKVGTKLGYDRLLYSDTDSVYFQATKEELATLPIEFHKSKIGAWDIEHENINMIVYGAKDYYKLTPENYIISQKLKGVPLHSNTIEEIDQNTFYYETWNGFHYGIKIKDLSHQYVTPVKKVLAREYTKAKILTPNNKGTILIKGTQKYNKDNEIYYELFEEPKELSFISSNLQHYYLKGDVLI